MEIAELGAFVPHLLVDEVAALTDYRTYSGFSAGNGPDTVLKAIIFSGVILWIVWGITAALRAWSAGQSDSITLVSIMIRGAFLFGFIGILLGILS